MIHRSTVLASTSMASASSAIIVPRSSNAVRNRSFAISPARKKGRPGTWQS